MNSCPQGCPPARPLFFGILDSVCLTRARQVKRGHRAVAMDGAISVAYLASWEPSSHALAALADALAACFSGEPPVFAVKPRPLALPYAGAHAGAYSAAGAAASAAASPSSSSPHHSPHHSRPRACSTPAIFQPPLPPPLHAGSPHRPPPYRPSPPQDAGSSGAAAAPVSSLSAGDERQAAALRAATSKVEPLPRPASLASITYRRRTLHFQCAPGGCVGGGGVARVPIPPPPMCTSPAGASALAHRVQRRGRRSERALPAARAPVEPRGPARGHLPRPGAAQGGAAGTATSVGGCVCVCVCVCCFFLERGEVPWP
jgi:hypothetical protein